MGVDLGELFRRRRIELKEISGRWIAVDAFNTLYQFLSIIRQQDGTPLMDSSGRVTSHLSGILYRITNLMEAGGKVAFVFDGLPPALKQETLAVRAEVRENAQTKWEEAQAVGEDGFKYAQAASRLNEAIISDSKRLLQAMGVPVIQAPSEGEAQAAYMAMKRGVDFVGSQDYDALLFGAPQVVRNLTITGKRKLPGKRVYVDVDPELISLQKELDNLGINQMQLVDIGILCGTDYHPGLARVGAKTALKLIREHGSLEKVLQARGEQGALSERFLEIREIFMNPEVTDDYQVKMNRPRTDEIISFLCQERDFSVERVKKATDRLEESYDAGQSTLDRWL